MLGLYKYHRIIGDWRLQRTINVEADAPQWLEIFQKDEPEEFFVLAKREPKGRPHDYLTRS